MGDKTEGLNDFYNGTLLFLPPLECFDSNGIFSVCQWKIGWRTTCSRIKSLGIIGFKKSISDNQLCLLNQNLQEGTLEFAFCTHNPSDGFAY